jgi:hypothetical protein
MRMQASQAREQLVATHGIESLKIRAATTERFLLEMYVVYWYAGIFAAIEGYEKLALSDPEVEKWRARSSLYETPIISGGSVSFPRKVF